MSKIIEKIKQFARRIVEKIKQLWLKVPKNIREAIKEILRWLVATLYSIIYDLVQRGEFKLDDPGLLLKIILFRLGDRILYLATQNKDKLNSIVRHALVIG